MPKVPAGPLSPAELAIEVAPQPSDTTCGATCLEAVYRYHGLTMPLDRVIAEVPALEDGGTLEVHLANHALQRGFAASLYTFNLELFDPSWFDSNQEVDLAERLQRQREAKADWSPKYLSALDAYLTFLKMGGKVRMQDLSPALIADILHRGLPILAGLSATYLYQEAREIPESNRPDDLRGQPAGHFVVISGFDFSKLEMIIADPLQPNPITHGGRYRVSALRTLSAILLGTFTYDASILVLEPPR